MPNTAKGLPYPTPSDPVAQGASAIQALAEAVDAQLAGKEIVYQPCTADASMAVPASPGAPFYNFPAASYLAVKHYIELFFPTVRANAVSTLYFALAESGVLVPGLPVAGVDVPNVSGGFGVVVALRIPFTPTAGNHTYSVNWIGNGTVVFTVKATGLAPPTGRIVRA